MQTKNESLPPFARLAQAYMSGRLSNQDFLILSLAMEDEPFFVKLRMDRNRPAPENLPPTSKSL